MCQVPAQLMSNTAYGYCRCGFDLCVSCHNNLPEFNELIPVRYKASDLMRLAVEPEDDGNSSSEWKE